MRSFRPCAAHALSHPSQRVRGFCQPRAQLPPSTDADRHVKSTPTILVGCCCHPPPSWSSSAVREDLHVAAAYSPQSTSSGREAILVLAPMPAGAAYKLPCSIGSWHAGVVEQLRCSAGPPHAVVPAQGWLRLVTVSNRITTGWRTWALRHIGHQPPLSTTSDTRGRRRLCAGRSCAWPWWMGED